MKLKKQRYTRKKTTPPFNMDELIEARNSIGESYHIIKCNDLVTCLNDILQYDKLNIPMIVSINKSLSYAQQLKSFCNSTILLDTPIMAIIDGEPIINPLKHCMYKSVKLVKDCNSKTIPLMLHTDAIARWMGFRKGDVIEIDNKHRRLII
jgi:hypothetical protein